MIAGDTDKLTKEHNRVNSLDIVEESVQLVRMCLSCNTIRDVIVAVLTFACTRYHKMQST